MRTSYSVLIMKQIIDLSISYVLAALIKTMMILMTVSYIVELYFKTELTSNSDNNAMLIQITAIETEWQNN